MARFSPRLAGSLRAACAAGGAVFCEGSIRALSNIANPADDRSLSYRFRARRDLRLKEFLLAAKERAARASGGPCRVADLGGAAAYWQRVGFDWLEQHGFAVDCFNLEASELSRDALPAGPVRLFEGNACAMTGHADDSYDIVHSNSVIEHVGGWPQMRDFAREVRRLAPSYYVQTPYFWSPVDPHFFRVPMIHWLPVSLRAKIHLRIGAGWAARAGDLDAAMAQADSNYMLDRSQFRALFPDAELRFERVLGFPKSMIATRLGRG